MQGTESTSPQKRITAWILIAVLLTGILTFLFLQVLHSAHHDHGNERCALCQTIRHIREHLQGTDTSPGTAAVLLHLTAGLTLLVLPVICSRIRKLPALYKVRMDR